MQSETCLSPASLSYAATVYNHSNGESRLYYFDAGGNITDGEKLILEEKKARYNAIGAMTDGLVAELSGKGESEEVPVWIWGKTYFEYPDKEAILKDQYAPASFEDTVYYEVEFANAAVMDAVTEAGGNADLFVIDAPMVHAYVTKAQLASVSKHPEVAYIFFDYGDGFPTSRTYIDAVDASVVHSWGIYGTNKYVGIQMWNRPDDTSRLSLSGVMNPNGSTSAEATMAAGVVKSNDSGVYWGIAPQSVVYFANMDRTGYSGSYPTAESWALAQGVKVFAYGWSTVNGSGNTVNGHDMYVDWLVKRSPYPLYVGSAGNSNGGDGRACSTNPAYQYVQNHFFNGLVVGGSDDKGTISNLDDTIYSCSSHRNPASSNNDRELPEVVAPAKCIDGGSKTCMDGTSAAASIVAGTAALIMQKNSALSSWPEAMRAVIMASSWTNVDGPALSFSDGTDDKDGIGQVNSAEAVDLADSANKVNGGNPARQKGFDYGTMNFPSSFPNNEYTEVYNIEIPPGGELQVALAWDATAACPRAENSNYDFCDSDRLDANLDIQLKRNGQLVMSSSSFDNSYEYMYFKSESDQTDNYQLVIRLTSYTSSSTYFGLAFRVYYKYTCGVLGNSMCESSASTNVIDTNFEVNSYTVYEDGHIPIDSFRLNSGETGIVFYRDAYGATPLDTTIALYDTNLNKAFTDSITNNKVYAQNNAYHQRVSSAPLAGSDFVVAYHTREGWQCPTTTDNSRTKIFVYWKKVKTQSYSEQTIGTIPENQWDPENHCAKKVDVSSFVDLSGSIDNKYTDFFVVVHQRFGDVPKKIEAQVYYRDKTLSTNPFLAGGSLQIYDLTISDISFDLIPWVKIASLNNSQFVVIWAVKTGNPLNGSKLFFKRMRITTDAALKYKLLEIDANPVEVRDFTNGYIQGFSVSRLGSGGFVIGWNDPVENLSFKIYNSSGVEQYFITDIAVISQNQPITDIITRGNDFYLIWHEASGNDKLIKGAKFNSSGQLLSGPNLLDSLNSAIYKLVTPSLANSQCCFNSIFSSWRKRKNDDSACGDICRAYLKMISWEKTGEK